MKYFEDFSIGQVFEMGTRTVSAEQIIDFARKYDPQPFHTDPEAAKQSMFGGLVASGWHTCALFMSMLVAMIRREEMASMGSPGIDTCRWLTPVRPGDTLTGRLTVLSARRSASRPFGLVGTRSEMFNQHGEQVLLIEGMGMYGLRPAGNSAENAA
ncbi:MAG TPA: MaoC family dehydratase [Alphaproteobacteria bacterium]|nr:MaoC family dehydratase [Alphaproteobacteria bacterium]